MKKNTFWSIMAAFFAASLFLGILSANISAEIAMNTKEEQNIIKDEPTLTGEDVTSGMLELNQTTPSGSKSKLGASAGESNYGFIDEINGDTISHSAFIAGTNVNVNASDIAGILFGAGLNINLRSNTEYAALAAQTVIVEDVIEKDLVAAAGTINIAKSAVIGRDVALAGSIVNLEGTYYGNVAIFAGTVNINNARILGDLNIHAGAINYGNDAKIYGTFTYDADEISKLPEGNINRIVETNITTPNNLVTAGIAINVINVIIMMIFTAAIVTRLVYHFAPKFIDQAAERTGFWSNFGRGILGIFAMPFVSVLLICIPGFQTVGFIVLTVFILALLISTAPATVILGNFVRVKMFKKKTDSYSDTLVGAILSVITPINIIVYIAGFGFGLHKLLSAPEKKAKK